MCPLFGIANTPLEAIVNVLTHPMSAFDISELRFLHLTHLEHVSNLGDLVGQLLDIAGPTLELLELWSPSGKPELSSLSSHDCSDVFQGDVPVEGLKRRESLT